MNRSDFMVRNDFPFHKLQTWDLPSPGAPFDPAPVAPSPVTPSTMSYRHGPAPHPTLIPRDIKQPTMHESLQPSDPRRDVNFLQRMKDHFARLLEMCGG